MDSLIRVLVIGVLCFSGVVSAEYDDRFQSEPPFQSDESQSVEGDPAVLKVKPASESPQKKGRTFFVPDTQRVDAGAFHVAVAAGGNFFVEPEVLSATMAPTGDYFKDFGFQAGVYFDYDYSELPENIPLALRGMVGYKYVLGGTHVFAVEGLVRKMFRMSDAASFGLGIGGSAATWYREAMDVPVFADEQVVFLPSLVIGAGFDFNPFMVDLKWLINRFGENSTTTGIELNFGFRL